MKVVSRFIGATAMLVLAGCAVQSHTEVAIPILPGCDETNARLFYPHVSNDTARPIPSLTSVPMRLCRYRWDYLHNKLSLAEEVTLSAAPTSLLQAFSHLKTVYQVYGPNAVFPCPLILGNLDLVIFQTTSMSDLTVIGVQRDGCAHVGITHDNFATYIAYLGSKSLSGQLDAIKAIA